MEEEESVTSELVGKRIRHRCLYKEQNSIIFPDIEQNFSRLGHNDSQEENVWDCALNLSWTPTGNERGVLLTIKDYQELLERAQDRIDAQLIDEARTTDPIPWSVVKGKRQASARK